MNTIYIYIYGLLSIFSTVKTTQFYQVTAVPALVVAPDLPQWYQDYFPDRISSIEDTPWSTVDCYRTLLSLQKSFDLTTGSRLRRNYNIFG